MKEAPTLNLRDQVVNEIRTRLTKGQLLPDQRLSEVHLAEELGVSRNTLRESFRALTNAGLLTHIPHRGVFVTRPGAAAIYDIFQVRRMIECEAVKKSTPHHPALNAIKQALERAREAEKNSDWIAVGTANIDFHHAIIQLADSPRLERFFEALTAELRLVFGLIPDLRYLHATFLEKNEALYQLVIAQRLDEAACLLEGYLNQSERMLMAVYNE
ncbi:hypothetical protein LMG33818_000148 [Halomonadaceae bacterium LMG 33818]|uniref:GntR family transcriptional regulator n=1 Tax=Cernens ardua TaxID=3402176 RepID=UPI003EDC69CA